MELQIQPAASPQVHGTREVLVEFGAELGVCRVRETGDDLLPARREEDLRRSRDVPSLGEYLDGGAHPLEDPDYYAGDLSGPLGVFLPRSPGPFPVGGDLRGYLALGPLDFN